MQMFVPRYVLRSPEFPPWQKAIEQLIINARPRTTNISNIRYTVSVAWKCVVLPLQSIKHTATEAEKKKIIIHAVLDHVRPRAGSLNRLLAEVNKFLGCLEISRLTKQCCLTANAGLVIDSDTGERKYRGTFNSEHIRKLTGVDNMRDRCVLTILAQTGLRRRAVSWLRIRDIWDFNEQTCYSEGSALEKGGKRRKFPMGEQLRDLLGAYIKSHCATPSTWLFPSRKKIGEPIAACTVESIVKRNCGNLGIRGSFVHTHSFRRYVVHCLVAAGNSIDNVSKWIGHSNPKTTYQYYWQIELDELMKQMTIPWIQNYSATP